MNKEVEQALENILEQTGDNGYNFSDRLIIERALERKESDHKLLMKLLLKEFLLNNDDSEAGNDFFLWIQKNYLQDWSVEEIGKWA